MADYNYIEETRKILEEMNSPLEEAFKMQTDQSSTDPKVQTLIDTMREFGVVTFAAEYNGIVTVEIDGSVGLQTQHLKKIMSIAGFGSLTSSTRKGKGTLLFDFHYKKLKSS